MEIPKLKNVNDHIFYTTISSEIAKHFNKNKQFNKDDYIYKVYSKLIGVLNSFKPLQIGRILMAEMHPQINISNTTIKQGDYLRYIVENYFLRITVYKDVTFRFVAEVYQWEIKRNSQLQSELLKKGKNLDNSSVVSIIKRIDVLMKEVRNHRNRIAHEGGMLSDITFLEGNDYIDEIMPNLKSDKNERDAFFKTLVDDNLNEMLKIEEDLATDLLIVLDKLFPFFKEKAGL